MSGNVSHCAKVSAVAAVALCALLAPAKSYAQTDQTIVMVCSNPDYGPGQTIYTINLAAKTVSKESITPNPGGSPDPVDWTFQGTINEVTDTEIVMTVNQVRISLNRYTGNMNWQYLDATEAASAARVHAATGASCHKQQKQF
jgi:hypothetical protein